MRGHPEPHAVVADVDVRVVVQALGERGDRVHEADRVAERREARLEDEGVGVPRPAVEVAERGVDGLVADGVPVQGLAIRSGSTASSNWASVRNPRLVAASRSVVPWACAVFATIAALS